MHFSFLSVSFPEEFMLPCLSKQLFEIECPGCGLQRSIALLLKGDLVDSFLMYPGLFPMMALFAFLALNRFVDFRRANAIVIWLAGITVFAILANYFIKIIN